MSFDFYRGYAVLVDFVHLGKYSHLCVACRRNGAIMGKFPESSLGEAASSGLSQEMYVFLGKK